MKGEGISVTSHQNIIERIEDGMECKHLTAAQANVELIRAERVRIIRGRVPRDVRSALNAAVKTGELGHFKKDGLKPECYYHPTFEHLAIGQRNKIERESIAAIKRVGGWAK